MMKMTQEKRNITVIAEAGVNHNGDMQIACDLIVAAAKAGADVVKFQTFNSTKLASVNAPKATYQQNTTGTAESQLDMIRKLEIPLDAYPQLIAHCQRHNIEFLSTPFDLESIEILISLGVTTFKIPSGEITNLPYLRKIGSLGQTVILSTGMSTLEEVAFAVSILVQNGTPRERISLLHCTTEYPAPFEMVNLKAMLTMREAFPGIAGVGYSDHTQGIAVPIAAAALGATIIEKHFTLNRKLPGPDHRASLEPEELTQMVKSIRQVELSLGNGIKKPTKAEIPNIAVARKSLVACRRIRKGELFSVANMTCKRPGNGLSPIYWDELIGRPASRDYAEDELLQEKI